MNRKTKTLKNYRECHVTNCTNQIYTGGYVCTTHQYRMKKFNSYDLPSHKGEPSQLIKEIPPEWSYGKCKNHGYLTQEQMYTSHTKGIYKTKGCRRCTIDRHIKRKYGLQGGLAEYEKLLLEQDNKCAICNQKNISLTNDHSRHRNLSIDHCHKTNKFRGIICAHCNSGLGYFKDSIETLKAAIAYLEKHQ